MYTESSRLGGVRSCTVPTVAPEDRRKIPAPLRRGRLLAPALGLPAPGDLPALCPQERLRAGGCAGTDLHAEAFAVTKELLGDAEAEDGVEVCLQGERGVPAGEAADPVVSGGLAPLTLTPLTLTADANGNADQNEATVGRELTRLRPVLLYS